MKFLTKLEEARESIVNSLKFVHEVEPVKQYKSIEIVNRLLREIDSLQKTLKTEIPDPMIRCLDQGTLFTKTLKNSDIKLMVLRLKPQAFKGQKISGYLETFHLPITIRDLIASVGMKYGGGAYQLRIVDPSKEGEDMYLHSKLFEIAGNPVIPQ